MRVKLIFCWGLIVSVSIAAMQQAGAQQMSQSRTTKGKDCRMEQQCHWKDFKKICVWVKVCR
jgi:hypothetical protein